ncbi:replicative helicase loader/inhibitor [Neobacillus mesonae]|uniref:replicative helicase loader/inhibitor n=1 Tax=Neobacillus mesonae TaxID=1193713 RepID=UPI00203CF3AE|nr:replicative helicase loader/inhibitor [Neobacillus mesonae]MCM3569505.1 replicative helicase loader/inhibitor [Neobacillus mesonae]
MKKKEVINLLTLIESAYPHCVTKDETVRCWFNFCSDIDYEKVLSQLKVHIRSSPFPPTIMDIAVFTSENDVPSDLQIWIKEGRERMEYVRRNAKRKPLPDWLREYSPRKSV